MTVFHCAKCGTELTPDLVKLPSVPDAPDHAEDRDTGTGPAASTVPRGHFGCGAPVATLTADCMGPHELHLDPVRVWAFDTEGAER